MLFGGSVCVDCIGQPVAGGWVSYLLGLVFSFGENARFPRKYVAKMVKMLDNLKTYLKGCWVKTILGSE